MDASEQQRLRRLETLVDNLYSHLGLDPAAVPDRAPGSAMPAEVAALVDGGNKIEAVKEYRELFGVGLHPGRDATIDIDELDAVLRSPHLPALAHLQVHMTTFGDEGAQRVVESGILKRLKTLDLAYGTMTDAGAILLASSSDVKRLDVLDVSRNALTATGIAALRAAGVRVVADAQHGPDDTEFLYEVDME